MLIIWLRLITCDQCVVLSESSTLMIHNHTLNFCTYVYLSRADRLTFVCVAFTEILLSVILPSITFIHHCPRSLPSITSLDHFPPSLPSITFLRHSSLHHFLNTSSPPHRVFNPAFLSSESCVLQLFFSSYLKVILNCNPVCSTRYCISSIMFSIPTFFSRNSLFGIRDHLKVPSRAKYL